MGGEPDPMAAGRGTRSVNRRRRRYPEGLREGLQGSGTGHGLGNGETLREERLAGAGGCLGYAAEPPVPLTDRVPWGFRRACRRRSSILERAGDGGRKDHARSSVLREGHGDPLHPGGATGLDEAPWCGTIRTGHGAWCTT